MCLRYNVVRLFQRTDRAKSHASARLARLLWQERPRGRKSSNARRRSEQGHSKATCSVGLLESEECQGGVSTPKDRRRTKHKRHMTYQLLTTYKRARAPSHIIAIGLCVVFCCGLVGQAFRRGSHGGQFPEAMREKLRRFGGRRRRGPSRGCQNYCLLQAAFVSEHAEAILRFHVLHEGYAFLLDKPRLRDMPPCAGPPRCLIACTVCESVELQY